MSAIKQYFWGRSTGVFLHPIRRGEVDRQYTIGRIVQSLLVASVVFSLYSAITEGLGEDPIKFFEDNAACQMTSSAIGGLALAYIIWGARGENECRQLAKTWREEDLLQWEQDRNNSAKNSQCETPYDYSPNDSTSPQRTPPRVRTPPRSKMPDPDLVTDPQDGRGGDEPQVGQGQFHHSSIDDDDGWDSDGSGSGGE